MKKVFADTVYWVAIFNQKDAYHSLASGVAQQQDEKIVLTTDAVLTEVLNQFAGYGEFWREVIALKISRLLVHDSVSVIPVSRTLFVQGLELYQSRLDKKYSHVDCISMIVMKNENINEVLSTDRHFEQEGFTLLLKTK